MIHTIKISIIDRDGKNHDVDVPTDLNLNVMEVCRAADLPMEGTCGGMALCASCHVYVESDHKVLEKSEEEEDMLDQAFFVEDNSRLACQMNISEKLEGIVIRLADETA